MISLWMLWKKLLILVMNKLNKRNEDTMATAKKKSIKRTDLEKGPMVHMVTIEYENVANVNFDGTAVPYVEEVFYCSTVTSISKKVMDSLQLRLVGDPDFLEFLLKDECTEFRELLVKASIHGSVSIESPDDSDVVLSLTVEKVEAAYISPTAVRGMPTVVADNNFIELTKVDVFDKSNLELDDENEDAEEGKKYYENYDLIYIRADSIVSVCDAWVSTAAMNLGLSEPITRIGSIVCTNYLPMRGIQVMECPAVVMARMRAVAFEKAEILAFEGTK